MSAEQNKVVSLPALVSGGKIAAIVPQNIDEVWRFASMVVKAQMAPKSLDTVEKATVAISYGLEVGLTPMAALQSIAVINGNPTIFGDGMLALVRGSGLLEDIEETVEYDTDGSPLSATCTVKRVGEKTPSVQMFTRVQAQKAGLWNKAGPWTQYPQRMMQMRARSWALRDKFADVMRGLNQTEEAMDMVDVTARGSATTAPAEPKRSDFVRDKIKAFEEGQPRTDDYEPQTWELFDEVGELAAAISDPGDWGNKLVHMASKLSDKARAQILENNAETAKAIWEDDDTTQMVAEGIKELYTPAAEPTDEKSAPAYWHLGDGILGEANIIQAIMDMIDGDAVTEPADVENIIKQNQDRMAKMSPMKRAGLVAHADKRYEALQKAPA